MARWIVVGVEILLQMALGLGIFLRIYGCRCRRHKWRSLFLIFFIIFLYGITVRNYVGSLISTGAALVIALVEALWLALWIGGHIKSALCWSFFYNCMIMLLEMSVLIFSGLVKNETLEVINRGPNFLGSFLKMLLLIFLCGMYWHWRKEIDHFLVSVLEKKRWIFSLCSLLEMGFTIYLFGLIWDQFSSMALIMNLVLVLCMGLGLITALIWTQYIVVERENRMYLSRERMLQTEYELIRKEQEKSRKINHDHRYDLTYLYDCFQKENCEKGRDYIERKLEQVRKKRENEVWTGCSCIDTLISAGMERAEDNGTEFTVDVNLAQIPIAEYELFTILGNLLDNALEAAEKCSNLKKYVNLKIHTVNRMLALEVENGYQEEPQKRRGKFISLKQGEGEHGWGIENVREIVEKNGGTMAVEYADHVFRVYLMLGI